MLQAAHERYLKLKQRGDGPNVAVSYANSDAFFPHFDDNNKDLKKCCTIPTHAALNCFVTELRPAVPGRDDTCAALKVGRCFRCSVQTNHVQRFIIFVFIYFDCEIGQ